MKLMIVKCILKGGQTHKEDLRGRALGSLMREGRRGERTEAVVEKEKRGEIRRDRGHACM